MVESAGRAYLFDCPFDAKADEFPSIYEVYELTISQKDTESLSDWTALASQGTHLGKVPVRVVQFDRTKRESIDADVLSHLKP